MKNQFILACQEYFVKPQGDQPVKKHVRQHHETIAADAIAPRVKKLSQYISRCQRQHKQVRIPALSGAEWGQLLRALELKRAYA